MKIFFISFYLFFLPFKIAMSMDVVTKGKLTISSAWSRSTVDLKRPGSAYLSIKNFGLKKDSLIAVQTPIAKKAELHNHNIENGIMKMRRVPVIDLPPNSTITLKPGGFHIMLFKPNKKLEVGQTFPLTLTFKRTGNIEIMVNVVANSTKKLEPHKKNNKTHSH